jgi:LCP family protein required for cell wall assembly
MYFHNINAKLNIEKVSCEELGISEASPKEQKKISIINKFRENDKIINIALLGIDTRDIHNDTGTRSDSIIVASINRITKNIKVVSIPRDSYVNIEGYGFDKLNHAYAFGGPTLTVKTLNQNFDLNIKDFVVVNFFGMGDIIDLLGGVDIDIEDEEVQYVNEFLSSSAGDKNPNPIPLTNSGYQTLTGNQAVAYSRVRSTIGDDFKRTERQRTVLLSLGKKYEHIDTSTITSIVNNLAPLLKTNLNIDDMLNLSREILTSDYNDTISQEMIPNDECANGKLIDGIYYYVCDLEKSKTFFHEFLD